MAIRQVRDSDDFISFYNTSNQKVKGLMYTLDGSKRTFNTFGDTLKGVGKNLLNVGLNLGAMALAAGAVTLAIKGIDRVVNRTKYAAEDFAETKKELDANTSALDENLARLKEIRELKNAGSMTPALQTEYDAIMSENAALEQKVAYLERIAELEGDKLQKSALKDLESATKPSSKGEKDFEAAKIALKRIQEQNRLLTSGEITEKEWSEEVAMLDEGLTDYIDGIDAYKTTIENLLQHVTDPNEREQYENIIGQLQDFVIGIGSAKGIGLSPIVKRDSVLGRIKDSRGHKAIGDRVGPLSEDEIDYLHGLPSADTVLEIVNAVERYRKESEAAAQSTQVQESAKTLQQVTNASTALADAMKQQAEDGYLSVESLQALKKAGIEYADVLEAVDGQMRIGEKMAQDLLVEQGNLAAASIRARKEELENIRARFKAGESASALSTELYNVNMESDEFIQKLNEELVMLYAQIDGVFALIDTYEQLKNAMATALPKCENTKPRRSAAAFVGITPVIFWRAPSRCSGCMSIPGRSASSARFRGIRRISENAQPRARARNTTARESRCCRSYLSDARR